MGLWLLVCITKETVAALFLCKASVLIQLSFVLVSLNFLFMVVMCIVLGRKSYKFSFLCVLLACLHSTT